MIKPKIAFISFIVLLVFLIPFSYLFSWNEFMNPIIPGWKTIIQPYNLIGIIFKFSILIFVIICYWKLTKAKNYISKIIFFTHIILTIPSVFISKFPLLKFVEFQTENFEKFANDIKVVGFITIFINVVFLVMQILFFIHYYKIRKNNANNYQ